MNLETLKDNWNAYMAAYGSTVEDERVRLLEKSVADDVVFTNPGGEVARRFPTRG